MSQDKFAPVSIHDLTDLLDRKGALLGLDPGTKTIGVAISDAGRQVASPLSVIRRKKFSQDMLILSDIIKERAPVAIVIGLPVNMDGSEGPRAQSVRAFARNLSRHTDLPLVFWDERLSTVAVERTLLGADISRARRKDLVDKMAAAYILQGALDFLETRRKHL